MVARQLWLYFLDLICTCLSEQVVIVFIAADFFFFKK